jgi:hypothetical protein
MQRKSWFAYSPVDKIGTTSMVTSSSSKIPLEEQPLSDVASRSHRDVPTPSDGGASANEREVGGASERPSRYSLTADDPGHPRAGAGTLSPGFAQ